MFGTSIKKSLKKLLIQKKMVNDTEILSVLGIPVRTRKFISGDYWEARYHKGGNSGAGSYGRLALFKAEVINALVDEHNIRSVIEFGAGDGNQLSLLTLSAYTGFDVSESVLRTLRVRYAEDAAKRFYHTGEYSGQRADMAMSVDVIFHLVEDAVFAEYMERLFQAAERYVLIYSSNFEMTEDRHVRHRRFTDWVEKNQPSWKLERHIPNQYPFDASRTSDTTYSDFFLYTKTE